MTDDIAERSFESNITSNALKLSSMCSEIPSLAPIITPATAGLSRMNLAATFAMLQSCFFEMVSNVTKPTKYSK